MINDKIKSLRSQIKEEENRIRHCKHDFLDAKYDPDTVKEPYGYNLVAHGSDVWSEPIGYRDVKKDRWSRKTDGQESVDYAL